ncbi:MAG: phosphate signaling complex protein PhoU [Lachnospiraceae bacterium]|nr:phosphate signaling complex protein PhoU [Lachnospiraceae bacterium]
MRIKFDEQLDRLNVELIRMGSLCEESILAALKLLTTKNTSLADTIEQAEHDINQAERDIEALCMKLLLQQQPVARDLRQISSALKMISDMERIGDQALDIAEISMSILDYKDENEILIEEMAKEAIKMVTDSIDSFVKKDLDLANSVIQYDDIVDNYFTKIRTTLIENITAGKKEGEYYIDLLMISKYLERIGDHATNIAEWVVYSITGSH